MSVAIADVKGILPSTQFSDTVITGYITQSTALYDELVPSTSDYSETTKKNIILHYTCHLMTLVTADITELRIPNTVIKYVNKINYDTGLFNTQFLTIVRELDYEGYYTDINSNGFKMDAV